MIFGMHSIDPFLSLGFKVVPLLWEAKFAMIFAQKNRRWCFQVLIKCHINDAFILYWICYKEKNIYIEEKVNYHAMKKILLFWQFSSVMKSKSKTQ
jgi:hypothetical protein